MSNTATRARNKIGKSKLSKWFKVPMTRFNRPKEDLQIKLQRACVMLYICNAGRARLEAEMCVFDLPCGWE